MSTLPDRLALARTLTDLGRTGEAEDLVLTGLEEAPDQIDFVSLLAKIKHIRGELSQAVALWASIHARRVHGDVALPQLEMLRRLAEESARAAGEFMALADGQMVRKHVAQIELERAFRLMRDGRVQAAHEACETLAQRHRDRDREVYKLARLARAWIHELTGDLDAARAALEALGAERGLETDVDRLAFLVRICEKRGRPEDLRAAINVHRYLERTFGKLSSTAHLARLYRLVGESDAAAECAARYLAMFRRRMHRPTTEDLVRAAATRYLPLESLRAVRATELADADLAPGDLATGLRAALRGHDPTAAAIFEAAGGLGLAYAGDLRLAAGDAGAAAALWARGLGDLPSPDAGLVARMCSTEEGRMAIAPLLARPGWVDAAVAGLLEMARDKPDDASRWVVLAALEALAGRADDAVPHSRKAQALAEAQTPRIRPGRVLSAAVFHFLGKTKGLVHELWADRVPAEPGRGGTLEIQGNVTEEFAGGIRNVFVASRQYVRAKFPHLTDDADRWRYTFKVSKDDEPSGGLSAGLPTALAFVSLFVGRPVPPDVASSGTVVADAHDVLAVRNVGDVEPKIKGAYNRNVRVMLLPEESRRFVEASALVPREVVAEIVRFARTLDDALEHVFGQDVWEW